MEEPGTSTARVVFGGDDSYVSESNEVVNFKLVRTVDDIEDLPSFKPALSHQIFGDEETIYGYKKLEISIYYSAAKLNIYFNIKHDDVASTCVPANIEEVLSDAYKTSYTTDLAVFEQNLNTERDFKPHGEMLKTFKCSSTSGCYEMYRCTSETPGWLEYHEKLQTFLLWFVDAASYIVVDNNWKFFTLYEKYVSELTGDTQYAIIGYVTVYEYYAYPANIRPRISQMLVLPPFQKKGLGAILLNSICEYYSNVAEVQDITVEDPSPEFQQTRDYVDCLNCKALPSFTKEKLMEGYSENQANEARVHFKINQKQSRRVYEILRLFYTKEDSPEFTAFRLCVKKRLNAQFQRQAIMNKVDKSAGITDEERKAKLNVMFDELLIEYTAIVNKLDSYKKLPICV